MNKQKFAFAALLACLIALPTQALAATPSFPSTVQVNQFGEKSISSIVGGSNQQDCSFVVDSANVNGLGISSLVGAACSAVYMHTSQTAAVGNPNPAAGYILIKLAANYSGFLNGYSSFVIPAGSTVAATTGVTAHGAYIVSSVGTTTLAGWQNLGLPVGLTPAAGQFFVAPGTTVSTGTGVIAAPNTVGLGLQIGYVGNPAVEVAATGGAQILLQTLAATSSSVTTPIPTAPADNSVVHLRFSMLPLVSALK